VIYGVVGYKTHAKMMLILRRENGELCRYAHLGTGNYHAGNARLYTDYSLLTSDDALCEDVSKLFSQLIGMGKVMRMKKLLHSPFTLKKTLLDLIALETQHAAEGKPAHIILKVNALTDAKMIKALYKASQTGVRIDLIVRGMCEALLTDNTQSWILQPDGSYVRNSPSGNQLARNAQNTLLERLSNTTGR